MDEVEIFKALGNSTRLRILDSVKNKKQCICDIIPFAGKSQPDVSYHIKILKNAGFISEQKEGTNIFIEASNQHIFELIGIARRLNE
jgi:ArsR family transcriptional regulator